LIHYPPVPPDAPAGAVRAAAHEDINLVTLLAEGSTGGLELLSRDGHWEPVQSLRGHLVINAGDMLQRATHGRIRSTTHRVVNPVGENSSRFSIPFFTHPRPDVLLEPMAPEPGYQGPAFTPITAGDYLRERLAAIEAEK
jgi:isopenicillin N synthase-like dioxygenase